MKPLKPQAGVRIAATAMSALSWLRESVRRSALWWVAAVLFIGSTVIAYTVFGLVYGTAAALTLGLAALGAYWKVRD